MTCSWTYLDGVQITRDLNDIGGTIGLDVGHIFLFPNLVVSHTLLCMIVIKVVKG